CERGRVVDAVADHGHPAASCLEFSDLGCLVAGEDLGDDGVDAQLFGDPPAGRFVVAREHHDLDTGIVEGLYSCFGRGSWGVGNAQHADGVTIDGDEDGRTPVGGDVVLPGFEVADLDAVIGHQLRVADDDLSVGDSGERSVAGDILEVHGRAVGGFSGVG